MSRGYAVCLTEVEQTQIIAWSQQRIGPTEQARRLGRMPTELTHYRKALRDAGVIPSLGNGSGRNWSQDEISRLIDLIDQGHGYAAIARRLGRSKEAVLLKAQRINHRLLRSRAALTAREVGKLLGLGCSKTVSRWIERYGLKARNAGTKHKPLWRVQWEDVCAWLEEPEHWMAYDPTRCTNPSLREHLIELRAGRPRWLTPGDVARRYCVTWQAVKQWISKGFLPAVRYGNWWINERDLAGWLPPCERSKAGIPKASGRRVDGLDRIVAAPKRRAA